MKRIKPLLILVAIAMIALSGCPTDAGDSLSAPENLRAVINQGSSSQSITVTWTPVNGAYEYEVRRANDDKSSDYICIKTDNKTTVFTDYVTTTGTYYYKVRGKKSYSSDNAPGKWSKSVMVFVDTVQGAQGKPTVTNISAAALSMTSIKVIWDPVEGASKYVVYRLPSSASNAVGIAVGYINPPAAEFTDTALSPNTVYYYRISIIASDGSEGSRSSTLASATTEKPPLPAPKELKATASEISSGPRVILKWEQIPGASYYDIRRRSATDTNYFLLTTCSASTTTYTDSNNLISGKYFYVIGAKRTSSDIVEEWSEPVDIEVYVAAGNNGFPPAPTNLKATVSAGSSGPFVLLSWTPASDASYYNIYRSTDNSFTDCILLTNSVTTTVYTDSYALINGGTYYYKIGARKGYSDLVGELSESAMVYVELSGITGLSATALSESSIKVTWDADDSAYKYAVYRALTSSAVAGEPVAYINAPSTEFIDTSLSPRTTYYYRIAIVESNGHERPQSYNYSYATTSASPPKNLIATANGRVITLEWDAVEGAGSYYIYGSLSQTGPYAIITTFSSIYGTVYNVATLTSNSGVPLGGNTTYYFKISTNGGVMSDAVSATTGP